MTDPSSPRNWKLLEIRPLAPGRGRLISIANQKGGVAKTTTAVNLAAGLALRGHKVLVIDIDPQSNATTGLGVDHRSVEYSTYDLITGGARFDQVVRDTDIPGLHVVPSSLDLAGAEIELVGSIAREKKLAEALEGIEKRYELMFIDCPPSLGLLTINALAASSDLIIPVQCEFYALEGLGQLLGTAERIRRSLNTELRISGFLLTMFDARTNLATQVADDVRGHFGDLVLDTIIPRSVRISESPSFGEPVLTLDPSSRGAVSYRLLAAEIEARYALDQHPPAPPQPASVAGGNEPRAEAHHHDPKPTPGPGGRGYGTVAAEPPGLDRLWPRRDPWTVRT